MQKKKGKETNECRKQGGETVLSVEVGRPKVLEVLDSVELCHRHCSCLLSTRIITVLFDS